MSTPPTTDIGVSTVPVAPADVPRRAPRSRRTRAKTSLLAHGEPSVWLTGGALGIAWAMIVGMLLFILIEGGRTFWPQPVYSIRAGGAARLLGELSSAESFRPTPAELASLAVNSPARQAIDAADGWARRVRVRTGKTFAWVNEFAITDLQQPEWALVIERLANGRIYGTPSAWVEGDKTLATEPAEIWAAYSRSARRDVPRDRYALRIETPDGGPQRIDLADIVRAYPPNHLSWWGKLGVYASRWWEFVSTGPREANSEGGVFPAIVGTVTMTLLMSLAVMPFGILTALYLREYARPGPMVSLVRIAVNNLAGVPSVVFGVFGLGFFCYVIGATVDQLFFADQLPAQPTFSKGGLLWASLTLALLTLPVVIVATEEALAAVPRSMREGSYACGASKWQTIHRIVLPRALPGIMTGLILAMARGAGEVAPLMLVGVTNLAFELPIDGSFPWVHPGRKFMHLAFQIYDLGYQSPYSEAARPLVYTTTLLLLALVTALNLAAIWLRSRLRRRHAESQF